MTQLRLPFRLWRLRTGPHVKPILVALHILEDRAQLNIPETEAEITGLERIRNCVSRHLTLLRRQVVIRLFSVEENSKEELAH
jgi:hypothetical protein